jgi:hypothetical protein
MRILITVPAIFTVAGALVYGLSSNPKPAELGRLSFACGLLALLLGLR